MQSITTLLRGARMIVEDCMSVDKNDNVLVIADDDHMRIAEAIAGQVHAKGGVPVIANVTPQVVANLNNTLLPMDPPPHLWAAMVKSDEVIITTNLEWANRFALIDAVRECCDNGIKVASIEEGMAEWDLTMMDITEIINRTQVIIDAMKGARNARVTSTNGTDVRLSIEGRPALKIVPIKEKGIYMGPIPLWGEVAFAPVEARTEGNIVISGVMLGVGLKGSLKDPIIWTVERGKAAKIEGGEEAWKLSKVVAGSDANADVVGEFSIGTSHKEKYGSPSEKGMLSTCHFALGDNSRAYPGGQNRSQLHLDGTVRDVTIEVDGHKILVDGKLVI